jgi:hypothetical protein
LRVARTTKGVGWWVKGRSVSGTEATRAAQTVLLRVAMPVTCQVCFLAIPPTLSRTERWGGRGEMRMLSAIILISLESTRAWGRVTRDTRRAESRGEIICPV